MNRKWIAYLLFMVLAAVVPGATSALTPSDKDALCKPPATKHQEFVVDLRNGETDGKQKYKTDDQVRLVFKNKNPFVFDYQIAVKAEPMPEPALEAFLALSGLSKIFEPDPDDGKAKVEKVESADAGEKKMPAEKLMARLQTRELALQAPELACRREKIRNAMKEAGIVQTNDELNATFSEVASRETELSQLLERLRNNIAESENMIRSTSAACEDLVSAVEELKNKLNAKELKQRQKELDERLTHYRDLIGTQRLGIKAVQVKLLEEGCETSDIDAELNDVRENLNERHATQHLERLQRTLDLSKKVVGEFASRRKAIETILGDPGVFFDTKLVGGFDKPHKVHIVVKKKKKDDKKFGDDSDFETTLSFGGRQRFALALGVAASSLDSVEYEAIQGFELDREGNRALVDGNPNLTRVIGLGEDSNNRFTPLLALHTRIVEPFWISSGLHVTLGLTGNFTAQGTDIEYLAGLSLSFAEERFFVTVGAYNGRQQSLEGDFYVGAALPDEVAEVPIRRDRDWDLGIALTYKIR